MEFTKHTYKRARKLWYNRMWSFAHILEYAKERGEPEAEIQQVREAYFDALHRTEVIVQRGRREKGLWPVSKFRIF